MSSPNITRRTDTQAFANMLRSRNSEIQECTERIKSHPAARYLTYQVLFDRVYTEIRADIGVEARRKRWSFPETIHACRLQATEYLLVIMEEMEELLSKVSQ